MTEQLENTDEQAVDDSSESIDSFKSLMEELKNGSEEAAWKITEDYSDPILRAVRKRLPREIRSKVDSIDIVNSMWGSFFLNKNQFTKIDQPRQLVALLMTIVTRRVIDQHRKYTTCASRSVKSEEGVYDEHQLQNNRKASVFSGNGTLRGRQDTPSQIAMFREKWIAIKSSLSDRDQEIVTLAIAGFTSEQIAEKMSGVSARNARRIVSNVTRMLS